jgi:hypothetical protein
LNPMESPDQLGWVEVAPTSYQANTLGFKRNFVLGTRDGVSRRDLLLTAAAMPRPILLRPNTYEWNGVPVPPPSTWASFRVNLGAAEFDVEVEPLDISEVTVRPTPVIRK